MALKVSASEEVVVVGFFFAFFPLLTDKCPQMKRKNADSVIPAGAVYQAGLTALRVQKHFSGACVTYLD